MGLVLVGLDTLNHKLLNRRDAQRVRII